MAGQGRFAKEVVPGAKFTRLTVIRKLSKEEGNGRYKTLCVCDCGKEIVTETNNLTSGNTKSCGCFNRETMLKRSKKRSRASERGQLIVKGARFGRLVVIVRLRKNGLLTERVRCLCDCGNETKSNIDGLIQEKVKSCGCLNRENTAKRNKETAKFGGYSKRNPKTFLAWASMKNRCYNKKQKAYPAYGGQGVVVCKFLRKDPRNLVKLIGLWTKKNPSLDRFPIHDGDYTCGQCKECKKHRWNFNIRWATRKIQAENRGDFNVHLTAFGRTLIKSQWMELSGLSWSCLTRRLRRGWDIERSLTTPDKKGNRYVPDA